MPESSTGPETEGDPSEVSQPDSAAAVSSTQEGGDLISSVTEALKDREGEPPPSSEQASAEKSDASQPAAEDPLSEITDAELNRYGPRTQRRIKQLLDARSGLHTEVEGLRPRAQAFDKIDEFIRSNRLTNEDFSILLELGGLVRNDPFKAFERFSAITQELAKTTGHQLPPDLQERVKLGYLSEQDARELVQSRQRAAFAEQRAKEQTEQSTEEQNRQRVQAHVQTCRQTANDWEAQRRSTDPDWKEKQDKIAQLIELQVYRHGYPNTQTEVVQMLDKFLTDVNAEFARYRPQLKEVRPTVGSASPRASMAEPKSLMEAIDAALAQ